MADFHQFFTILMAFINIGPVYIRGWVGGSRGWGGWWQKLNQRRKKTYTVEFRVAMMCTGTHKRANIPLQDLDRHTYTHSWSHIRSPLPTCSPPLVPIHQSWIYMVSIKHSGKADQSTLASGGSKHASYLV